MAGMLEATVKPGALKNLLDNLEAGLDREAELEAEEVKKDFEETTSSWHTKVQFQITKTGSGQRAVTTDSKIYIFVNEGTSPHVIRAKNAKVLAFMTPYAARTKPGSLNSGAGGVGNNPVFTKEVNHPGTKPRRFDELIAEKSRVRFRKRVQALLASMTK